MRIPRSGRAAAAPGPGERGHLRASVDDVVAEVLASSPVEVAVRSTGWAAASSSSPDPTTVTVPDHLGPGLSRLLGEALRNVARHSGTDSAELEVEGLPEHLVVRVVDHGRGLPVPLAEGFGMGRSIRGVAADLDAEVHLRDTPGGGATVEVRVPLLARPAAAPPGPRDLRAGLGARMVRTYDDTVSFSGGTISLVRAIAWPQGAVWAYLAARYSLRCPDPVPLLLLAAALAVLTALVARRLERRAPTTGWLAGTALALVAAEVVGLVLLPPGAMLDYRSWSVGSVAVPVMILCVFLPLWLGVLVALPHLLVVLAVASADPSLTLGRFPVGSSNAAASTAVLGMAVGLLLRRTTKQARADQDRLEAAESALLAREARSTIASLHLDHTLREVVPWLERVARGEVPVGDDATRSRARTLALEVRDDLYAPGLLRPAARDAVSGARGRGARIEIGAGLPTGPGTAPAGELLRVLAAQVDAGAKVTLSPAGRGQARLVVVPPLEDPVLAGLRRTLAEDSVLSVDADAFRTVVVLSTGTAYADLGDPGEVDEVVRTSAAGGAPGSGGTTSTTGLR